MTTIIAEIGINHNGSMDNLLKLADMSMECGADFVKLQTRTPRVCVPESEWGKQRTWFDGKTVLSYIEYKERMEFTTEQLRYFDMYMQNRHGKGKWSSSAWDVPALIKLVDNFNLPWIKVPSAKLTDDELIAEIIGTNIPVVMSTGMSTVEEIDHAVSLFPSHYDLTLLYCDSTYPSQDKNTNLKGMDTLAWRYGVKIGYSSHNKSPWIPVYASLLGAEVVEAHVTLDRTMMGSDQAASLERHGLELLCREVKRIPTLLGDGKIYPRDSELEKRKSLRGS